MLLPGSRFGWLPAVLVWLALVSLGPAQQYPAPANSGPYAPAVAPYAQPPQSPFRPSVGQPQAPYRLAERATPAENLTQARLQPASEKEHPLMPALRWAAEGLREIEKLEDYQATLVKRERVGGELSDFQYMFIKVRHQPFSVYSYFLAPAAVQGQEVIYVAGQNDGNMWAHANGIRNTMFGTVKLKPTGMLAMQGQRYPITEIGIQNLVRRLLEIGDRDTQYGECEVKFFEGAKINGRACTCIQVVHPVPRRNFLFHLARIFVDVELNVPIRYEAYDWPAEPNGQPQLIEEYTYLDLKFNNGFTDADFDIRNPNYKFKSR